MTARPFVSELRTRDGALRIGSGTPTMTLRVEAAEVWDAVIVETNPSSPVSELKRAAVTALLGAKAKPDDFVLKLRGFEVLNEEVSLAEAGAIDGSIFLVTYRRRRPVR
jgi:hypothetical protein